MLRERRENWWKDPEPEGPGGGGGGGECSVPERFLPGYQGNLLQGDGCAVRECCEAPVAISPVSGVQGACKLPEIFPIPAPISTGILGVAGTTTVTGTSPLVLEYTVDTFPGSLTETTNYYKAAPSYNVSDLDDVTVSDVGGAVTGPGGAINLAWGPGGTRHLTAYDGIQDAPVRAVATWSTGPSQRTFEVTGVTYEIVSIA